MVFLHEKLWSWWNQNKVHSLSCTVQLCAVYILLPFLCFNSEWLITIIVVNRTKPVVSEAKNGGKDCEQEYERKECEDVPCYWWHAGKNENSQQCCIESLDVAALYMLEI